MQVTITVANGKITNANGSLPGGGDSIGQNAIPQLNQEVLTVQSANIQAVSGATSTSEGYIASLQQARSTRHQRLRASAGAALYRSRSCGQRSRANRVGQIWTRSRYTSAALEPRGASAAEAAGEAGGYDEVLG